MKPSSADATRAYVKRVDGGITDNNGLSSSAPDPVDQAASAG